MIKPEMTNVQCSFYETKRSQFCRLRKIRVRDANLKKLFVFLMWFSNHKINLKISQYFKQFESRRLIRYFVKNGSQFFPIKIYL